MKRLETAHNAATNDVAIAKQDLTQAKSNLTWVQKEVGTQSHQLVAIKKLHKQRTFTKEQREIILRELKDLPKGKVHCVVAHNATDEARAYRDEFVSLLEQSGGFWLFSGEFMRLPSGHSGVRFWINPNKPFPAQRWIIQAFKAAHVECEAELNPATKEGELEIFIGAKENAPIE